jgi:hypothetical protein
MIDLGPTIGWFVAGRIALFGESRGSDGTFGARPGLALAIAATAVP